jgi:hypothetical protein
MTTPPEGGAVEGDVVLPSTISAASNARLCVGPAHAWCRPGYHPDCAAEWASRGRDIATERGRAS